MSSKLESLTLSSPEPLPSADQDSPIEADAQCQSSDQAPSVEAKAEGLGDNSEEESDVESDEAQEESDRESAEDGNPEDKNDDDGGWITPGNVQTALNNARRDDGVVAANEEGQPIPVACLSTDFAVQNVLLHMGLRLTSADGMLIKRLRTYVLRCFGCFKYV